MSKKNQKHQHNICSYFSFDSFDFITLIVKEQNKKLLIDIGKKKGLDKEELDDFFNDFFKVGYYTPILTKYKYEEDIQIHMIKKKIKLRKQSIISNFNSC